MKITLNEVQLNSIATTLANLDSLLKESNEGIKKAAKLPVAIDIDTCHQELVGFTYNLHRSLNSNAPNFDEHKVDSAIQTIAASRKLDPSYEPTPAIAQFAATEKTWAIDIHDESYIGTKRRIPEIQGCVQSFLQLLQHVRVNSATDYPPKKILSSREEVYDTGRTKVECPPGNDMYGTRSESVRVPIYDFRKVSQEVDNPDYITPDAAETKTRQEIKSGLEKLFSACTALDGVFSEVEAAKEAGARIR